MNDEISIPTFEDEIYRRESLTSFSNGHMTDQVAFTFGDNSMLLLEVRVNVPRSSELIATDMEYESYDLMMQSTAVRLLYQFILSPALTRLPECKQGICPICRSR